MLTLDVDGIIQDVALANTVSAEPVQDWRGRPWIETLTEGVSGKVERMLAEARDHGVSAFRQLNQRFPSGLEVPMEYTAVRLGGAGGLIAIGRNLHAVAELQSRLIAAQQAMEQEYWKLREVETRYRVLFDASNEAVLTLNADTLRIIEVNPVAIRSLGLARGRDILSEIVPEEQDSFLAMLRRVRQAGRAPGLLVHFGLQGTGWLVRASLMPAEPAATFLIQLSQAAPTPFVPVPSAAAGLDEFFDRLPDAVVVIDREGFVRKANQAFLDLAQLGGEGAALGQSLGRWLSRPGADLGALLANLNRHGSVRLFATSLNGELGDETEVEICAVGNTVARPNQIALLIRDVGRRLSVVENGPDLQSALAGIIEQSGRTPLRILVQDTVALVERHYILTALALTNDNRTAAAEMLGLSRQGFYKKLAHYGIDGPRTDKDLNA
jgi:transcriptional regulator PpsR